MGYLCRRGVGKTLTSLEIEGATEEMGRVVEDNFGYSVKIFYPSWF